MEPVIVPVPIDACAAPSTEEIVAEVTELTLEDLKGRQKEERKQLQITIQKLKSNAPKNNKKQRKAAMDTAATMESEMKLRHTTELEELEQKFAACKVDSTATNRAASDEDLKQDGVKDDEKAPRLSKAQRRREAKANKERERELERQALAAEDQSNSKKEAEKRGIAEKLEALDLTARAVPSDGDCLYNAIRHQLQVHDLPLMSVQELRAAAGKYIRANKDMLIDYMLDPNSGLPISDDAGFEKYCHNVEQTTTWGGHIELKAISDALKVKITVLHADAPPTVLSAVAEDAPELIITFHQFLYQLGEHYNSTTPLDYEGSSENEELEDIQEEN